MKFNWGTGIALFYATFVVVLVFVVFKSRQYDNSLVSDHYYADDIAYQQRYDKLKNSQQLGEPVAVVATTESIEVRFPQRVSGVTGEVWLFNPSDSRLDKKIPIALGTDNAMRIPSAALKKGKWEVKIDWAAGEKGYYQETTLVL